MSSRLATDDVAHLLLFEPNDAMIVPFARFRIVCMMIKNPPFTKRDSPLNTESLMEDLWRMMTWVWWLVQICRLKSIYSSQTNNWVYLLAGCISCSISCIHVIFSFRCFSSKFAYDSRLRCAIADLYYTLYGKGRPSCLPPLEVRMESFPHVLCLETCTSNNIIV